MLHRAASNAYSWWWASHIRTKQSKWLDESLLDMQEKVANVLKLINEEGDSFAKRANMYYKNRPELIYFVEESYRAYRSLAERYDHISTELQNANNTIASCFPDQVPFMDEDDDDLSPRAPLKMPECFKPNNVPDVPKPPVKRDLKTVITTATKKFNTRKNTPAANNVPKSGLSKKEIRDLIDKYQKEILALQTVKEFVKSSYDNALARYWETEEQIKALQQKVSALQNELGEGITIDDEEARRLMAQVALRSCQETLTSLQEKQDRSVGETKIETKRIKESRKKIKSLMDKFDNNDQSNNEEPIKAKKPVKGIGGKKEKDQNKEVPELQVIEEKIKQHFHVDSDSSLSVTEMAEKIEELVNKVIGLETSISSQTALVKTLRTETDELQSQVRTLEDDKACLLSDKTDLNNKLKEMEEKIQQVQDLNEAVKDHSSNLQAQFTEASNNLDNLSGRDPSEKPDKIVGVSKTEKDLNQAFKDQNSNLQTQFTEAISNLGNLSERVQSVTPDEIVHVSKTEKDLNQAVKDQISNLQAHFIEASRNLDNLSETVQSVKPDEIVDISKTEKDLNKAVKDQISNIQAHFTEAIHNLVNLSETVQSVKPDEIVGVSKTEKDLNQAVKDHNSNLQAHSTEASHNLGNLSQTVQGVKPDEIVDVSKTEEDLNQAVKNQNSNLEDDFADASSGLDHFSEKVQHVKPDDIVDSSKTEGKSSVQVKSDKEFKVIGLTENVAQGKQLKVGDSVENVVHQDDEKKITGSPENDVKLDKELNTFTPELKEQAETSNLEDSNKSARDSLSAAAGNQELGQRGVNNEADSSSVSYQKGNNGEQISSGTQNMPKVDYQQETVPEDGPDWQHLPKEGIQDREKALLAEYTNVLRGYKEMKKKLSDLEKKNQDSLLDSSLQLKELKTDNAMKDDEIRLLRQKLSLLQRSVDGNEDNQDIEAMLKREQPETSAIEEKFRTDIDEILEENLDFWLRFCTTFTETQKFEDTIRDLQADVLKYEEKRKSEGSSTTKYNMKSDSKATFKHLTEIQAEITVWLEKTAMLKEELQCRFSSLCEIQEEIMKALKSSAEDEEFKFTSYQAAKFQGEVLNMKQENHRVADELQAGLDHVTTLQIDVERALAKLNEQFGLTNPRRQENGQVARRGGAGSQSSVPLKSFIFGVKPTKKQTKNIFLAMTPGMQRKHRRVREQGSV